MIEVADSTLAFADKNILDKDVAICFGKRILHQIKDSGKSANLIAIDDASGFGPSLYGIGSYGGYIGLMNRIPTLPDCGVDGAIPQKAALRDLLLALPYTTKAAVDTVAAM